MAINGHSMSQMVVNPLTMGLLANDTDRTLVLIRLNGGNDGLNTIIPLDQYENLVGVRPQIVLPENEIISLTENHFNSDNLIRLCYLNYF